MKNIPITRRVVGTYKLCYFDEVVPPILIIIINNSIL